MLATGHDSLYPGLDVVNAKLGGSAGLNKLVADAKRLLNATMSYHIDVDIASSMTPTQHYEGPYDKPASPYDASVPNPEFDLSSMRTNADHQTPWCSNSTYWTLFWPKAGLECSIQKTKDWVYGGKSERVGRFFKAVPSGMDTIHCDAWHDDGYSWEPEDVEGHGYIGEYENQPCGSSKDIQLFAARGISFGSEGPNGCTGNYLGADGKNYDRSDPIVGTGQSYWWHGAQYSQQYFGKIISGSEMGQDCDIAPWIGARCSSAPTATFNASDLSGGFAAIANRVYLHAKLLQVALTEELLGEDTEAGVLRFTGQNRLQVAHIAGASTRDGYEGRLLDGGKPSTWKVCGGAIAIARGSATFLPKLVRKGVLDAFTFHAYQASSDQFGGGAAVTQMWTVPPCWKGKSLEATTIGPDGLSTYPKGDLSLAGGTLTLQVRPGRPVRIEAKTDDENGV